jgi:Fic family protein
MDSVRGAGKTPGAFRLEQNWIGQPGSTIEQASFVPPSPLQLQDHLEAWERYVSGDDVDVLVQCAVVHAQFELLHPFQDGNGRIGRLLIPLFLFQKRALFEPMFYLSEYLEAHRDRYYAQLRAISKAGDWSGWIAFFLDAIVQQAKDNTRRVQEILHLYEDMKRRIAALTHSQHAIAVLDALFDRPIFQSGDFVLRSGIPKGTALAFLQKLKEANILFALREASGRRPAVLAFRDLLNCAEGRIVF